MHIPPDPGAACAPGTRCLETELAAVLPFDVESYRRSRPAAFQPEFDRQLARCAFVLALDGIYEKPSPDTPAAKHRRARGYRAQSAFLLRQSDLLIAAANPDRDSKPGGTLETVQAALACDLPVVFIHTGRDQDNIYLIGPDDDLHSVLAESPPPWQAPLDQWVTQLTADPDNGLSPGDLGHDEAHHHGEELLREFFDAPVLPQGDAAAGLRKLAWGRLERSFRRGPGFQNSPPLAPYAAFRRRATELNHHYSDQYRGAFVLNYAAAIVAVALAAGSLALLGAASHTGPAEPIAQLLESAGQLPNAAAEHAPHPDDHHPQPAAEKAAANKANHAAANAADHHAASPPWLLPLLIVLTVLKLGIVGFIGYNTRRANRERWNDRAVDYRYLAERLRGMFYLPLAGSWQPPAAEPPQFASRVVRQSAVDWLFDALVRAISPADMPAAAPRIFPATSEHRGLAVRKLLTLEPQRTAELIRDSWIGEQAKYHDRNAQTMHALHHFIERAATVLSWFVIGVVVIDLLLLCGEVLHWLPEPWESRAKIATPVLIWFSAVLPAIVAALGGLRFQSECQRLAERSAVMRVLLCGRDKRPGGRQEAAHRLALRVAEAQKAPASDPGGWSHDVLRLSERVAADFVQEAAEWSVLYAKEVSDPG